LLGIIEGITEFLPISSTGHLLIAEHWLGHRSDLFNIVIQAGAILAVVLVFRERLLQLALGLATVPRGARTARLRDQAGRRLPGHRRGRPGRARSSARVARPVTPVAWALIIGGVWMLLVEPPTARLPDRDDHLDGGDPRGPGAGGGRRVPRHLALGLGDLPRCWPAPRRARQPPSSCSSSASHHVRRQRLQLLEMVGNGEAGHEDWTALAVAFVAAPSPASSR
jgi:undecaprenyl-diphosphatase